MAENNTEQQPVTVVSKMAGFIGLYTIFVFISGWTYLDYYLRSFGLNPSWLDISITETLMKGFTILFEGGECLWFIYIFLVVVPVLFEVFPKLRAHIFTQVFVALLMLSCLPIAYFISRSAGEKKAKINQGDKTELRAVTFELNCGGQVSSYDGRLLYTKGDLYYLHNVRYLHNVSASQEFTASQSPKDLGGAGKAERPPKNQRPICAIPGPDVSKLTIVRSDGVQAFQVVEIEQ